MAAAIHADHAAIVEHARLGLDVHDAAGAQAIFGGQGAGNQPYRVGQARIQGLSEYGNAFRQNDAVQPVLQAVMFAAHMQLTEAVLGHARHAQHHGIELGIVAARLGLNVLGGDGVGGGAGLGLDAVTRRRQLLRRHGHAFRGFLGLLGEGGSGKQRARGRAQKQKRTKHGETPKWDSARQSVLRRLLGRAQKGKVD